MRHTAYKKVKLMIVKIWMGCQYIVHTVRNNETFKRAAQILQLAADWT